MSPEGLQELAKLVGEERARPFAGDIDDANRTITETSMVTRADAPPVTPPTAPPTIAVVVPPTAPVAPPVVTRPDTPPAPPANEPPGEPTPMQMMDAIKSLDARVKALEDQQTTGRATAETEQKRATDALTDLTTRLTGVEEIRNRWLNWLNDAPEYIKVEADSIYRARDQEPAALTMAQLAEQNVAKLNRGPHQRNQD